MTTAGMSFFLSLWRQAKHSIVFPVPGALAHQDPGNRESGGKSTSFFLEWP